MPERQSYIKIYELKPTGNPGEVWRTWFKSFTDELNATDWLAELDPDDLNPESEYLMCRVFPKKPEVNMRHFNAKQIREQRGLH